MKTGVIGAFARGWTAAFGLRGLVFLRWAVNLACAVFIILPIGIIFANTWDNSLANDQFFQSMPMEQIAELATQQGDKFAMFVWVFLPILLFFVVANLFMSAGIMKAVNDGKPDSWPTFFSACSGYFFSMVRVALFCLILAALFIALPNALMNELIDRIREGATEPTPVLMAKWVKTVVIVLLISGVSRIYDYARLMVCRDKRAWRAFKQAISFTARNRFGSFGLWILFVGVTLASGLIYAKLDPVGVTSNGTILLSLLMGQLLLLFKSMNSVASLAGQQRFLASRLETPQPAMAQPVAPSPVLAPVAAEPAVTPEPDVSAQTPSTGEES